MVLEQNFPQKTGLFLSVLKNYLSLQNYYIVQANNGPQALAFIEKGFRGCFGKK